MIVASQLALYTDLSTLARVSKLNERSAANNSGTGVI